MRDHLDDVQLIVSVPHRASILLILPHENVKPGSSDGIEHYRLALVIIQRVLVKVTENGIRCQPVSEIWPTRVDV